ncbi:DUF3883 domain-containing protein [Bosea sp. (in: a-proteobacteria)]|uniref:DUF3883 domain-containing protein n=1 Tax=Bosea sp. (in: a-proteobacteria) TaxID=1871050 RepID=UPI002FC90CD7
MRRARSTLDLAHCFGMCFVMADAHWTDQENDLIVADYFEMLISDICGHPYVKAERRRRLLPQLIGRSEGSIEFKHQNISAVLLGLGQPWIDGYKPASQFQSSLVDAVIRRLDMRPGWPTPKSDSSQLGDRRPRMDDSASTLWIGPAPSFSNAPPPVSPVAMDLIARKYDVAGRDARNRALGRAGEEIVINYERAILRANSRRDLAERVRWIAVEDGDGAGYDIASFEPDGSPRLIEVKTTNGWERTPFHITRTELAAADANRDAWQLIRIWNLARSPKAFSIRPPLDAHVQLTPTSFLATL